MIYKIRKKLQSKKGETLIEILVSITVCLFAIICLLTAIVFTSKVTKQSRNLMNDYYNANNTIEKIMAGQSVTADDNVSVFNGTIKVAGKGDVSAFIGQTTEYPISIYVNSSVAAGSPPVIIYNFRKGASTPVNIVEPEDTTTDESTQETEQPSEEGGKTE